MPRPHHLQPTPRIWLEIWRRARDREAIGLMIETDNISAAYYNARTNRPPDCAHLRVARVTQPNGGPHAILIFHPEHDIIAQKHQRTMAMVVSDVHPELLNELPLED